MKCDQQGTEKIINSPHAEDNNILLREYRDVTFAPMLRNSVLSSLSFLGLHRSKNKLWFPLEVSLNQMTVKK